VELPSPQGAVSTRTKWVVNICKEWTIFCYFDEKKILNLKSEKRHGLKPMPNPSNPLKWVVNICREWTIFAILTKKILNLKSEKRHGLKPMPNPSNPLKWVVDICREWTIFAILTKKILKFTQNLKKKDAFNPLCALGNCTPWVWVFCRRGF
jgi:hypothetical protein